MKRDENGYIVVETIGCFVLFIFLITSILSLINIVTLQARIHYALSQTAQTLSMYCYGLEALDLADPMIGIAEKASNAQEEVDTFKNNLNTLIDAVDQFSAEKAKEGAEGMKEQWNKIGEMEPKEIFQDVLSYGADQLGGAIFEQVLQELMDRYLRNGEISGDEYLRGMKVVDDTGRISGKNALNFFDFLSSGSRLLIKDENDNVNVQLRVDYYIDYTFGALSLPFTRLHVTQEVTTKAWLGGEGEGYSK